MKPENGRKYAQFPNFLLTHSKAVSRPLDNTLSVADLATQQKGVTFGDGLVFRHLYVILCL